MKLETKFDTEQTAASTLFIVYADAEEVTRMGFEVFHKGSAPIPSVPAVTVQKRGIISLNRAAYGLLGEPAAVELLWDSEREMIGLRAAALEDPDAYPAREQKTKNGNGPVLIAGTLFTQFIGMDTTAARRWVPVLEGDILCVDIRKPGQTASSNRARKERDIDVETSLEEALGSVSSAANEEGTRQPAHT